ncbi:MAG: type II toxin-antitoxin system RelE/ParE family toxin [Desulfovibrio sp.]|nr:MAG: type II toxin-antitoxin system RelE/ParE family toxin [Desulfovibrio sp.]
MKRVVWIGSSLEELKRFPDELQRAFGYSLFKLQQGVLPPNAKPMSEVGQGVYRIAERFDRDTYRVAYIARFQDAIYVLHAFKKKSHKGKSTPREVINLVKERLKQAHESAKGENS